MDVSANKTTGMIIAEERKKRGYTQESLAEAMGVSRQAVSRWESDSAYPETEKLIKLARLLDLDLNRLLLGSEPPEDDTRSGDIDTAPERREYGYRGFVLPRYEYVSRTKLFGLPLVHINIGHGVYRAKGVIAIGTIATGLISIGIFSLGLISIGVLCAGLLALGVLTGGFFSIGAISFGIIAMGAVAIGLMSFGALSVGMFAFGGLSIGGYLAVGEHAYGGIVVAMTHGHGSIATFISTSASTIAYDRDALMSAIDANIPKFWIWFISIAKALL